MFRGLTVISLLLAVASAHPSWPQDGQSLYKAHKHVSPIGFPSRFPVTPYPTANATANATSAVPYTTSATAFNPGGGSCDPQTVTLTMYPTSTVTVTPSSSGYTSAISSSPESPPAVSTTSTSSATLSGSSNSLTQSSVPLTQSSVPLTQSSVPLTQSSVPLTSTSAGLSSSTNAPLPKPTNSSGSKRGLICNPEQVPQMAQYPKITWDMNWWEGPPPAQPSNWTFLPMLTHLQPDKYWATNIKKAEGGTTPYIAGFLEPDINNYAISDAVTSWKANIEPYSSQFKLIPPVPGQNGLSWLQEFMTACTGCTFNGPIAFNMYTSSDANGVAAFKNHTETMIAAFPGRELWIANMGLLDGSGNSEWLMSQLIPYLDSIDAVTHYAWVGGDTFWDGSNLTPLAITYATM